MAAGFGELSEACGAPRVLTLNTPRFVGADKKRGSWSVGAKPPAGVDPFGPLTRSCRIPYGEDPFLLIRTYVSVPTRRFQEVRAELEAWRIVEFRRGIQRGPRGKAIAAVEVAVAADVSGLSRDALEGAVADGRVLNVHAYRSMGDGEVTLDVATPGLTDLQVEEHGYHFVFEPPCRLTFADLPHEEARYYEREGSYLDGYWQRHFTRVLPLPPEPARPPRIRREGPRRGVTAPPSIAEPAAERAAIGSAAIQRRIDALHPTSPGGWGLGEWPVRVCKERLNALPLHDNVVHLWAIRPDGTVLCMDHVDPRPAEPETDPLTLHAVLVHGARRFPELRALVPARPQGARPCTTCSGNGARTALTGETVPCAVCWGLGWAVPGS